MTSNIVRDIFMAITKYAMTTDGSRPVYDEIKELARLTREGDDEAKWLLVRIAHAMTFAERHGIPDSFLKTLIEKDSEGSLFTLVEPVKELKHHQPLIELRVNKRNSGGAFRAIFFPFKHQDEQFLIYTHSVIKQDTFSADFEQAVRKTEAMIPDFLQNPSKYINLEEVSPND